MQNYSIRFDDVWLKIFTVTVNLLRNNRKIIAANFEA